VKRLLALVVVSLLFALVPGTALAKPPTSAQQATCSFPESNAEGLEILSNYYPGYWWDHTALTIAVQAHPNAADEQLDAIHDAIATWDAVLRDCFDGLITLTDVTDTQASERGRLTSWSTTSPGRAAWSSAGTRSAVTMGARTSSCVPISRRARIVTRTILNTLAG
jgi:hypothetical protein